MCWYCLRPLFCRKGFDTKLADLMRGNIGRRISVLRCALCNIQVSGTGNTRRDRQNCSRQQLDLCAVPSQPHRLFVDVLLIVQTRPDTATYRRWFEPQHALGRPDFARRRRVLFAPQIGFAQGVALLFMGK